MNYEQTVATIRSISNINIGRINDSKDLFNMSCLCQQDQIYYCTLTLTFCLHILEKKVIFLILVLASTVL